MARLAGVGDGEGDGHLFAATVTEDTAALPPSRLLAVPVVVPLTGAGGWLLETQRVLRILQAVVEAGANGSCALVKPSF